MDAFSAYIPVDRRHALARGGALSEQTRGAVLFTDISGFTNLTEALVTSLGIQRGSEELSRHLNNVYTVLIAEVIRYHGTVISSAGDALLSWFDGPEADATRRAVTAAFEMQRALAGISVISLPDGGGNVELAIKSAVAAGPAHRYIVGDPEIQLFDVLVGSLLDQVDVIENSALKNEVILTAEAAQLIKDDISIIEQRPLQGNSIATVVRKLNQPSDPQPWAPLGNPLSKEQSKPWLHPSIYDYINSGQEMFIAELRPAVALFLRFEGIDHDRDPQAGTKLNSFFKWVQKNVRRFDGTLIALTTGDKGNNLYIAFGMPYAHRYDSARAVALSQVLLAPPPEMDFIQTIQIGISRGTIWSGPIGGKEWRTFTAIGNEVNLAARLMQIAKPGQMLVSPHIAESTTDTYLWQEKQTLTVKGISKPVSVFQLLAVKNTDEIVQSSPSQEIIGRISERKLLTDMLANINSDTARIAVIDGEAGIGKSRLVADLGARAHAKQIPHLLGAGDSIDQSNPYHAWRPIFSTLFSLDSKDDGDARRQKARAWIQSHDPSLLDRLPLLDSIISLDTHDNELTDQMTGLVRAENARQLLIRILKLYIGETPKLLVMEDAHWLDSASWSLLADAAQSLSNIMIVITTRPVIEQRSEYFNVISNLPQTQRIPLNQMDETDITALVCQRLGVKALPEEVSTLILNKSEGHPFFSEELAYSLRETGQIVIEGGECKIVSSAGLQSLNFPDTVQGVVTSRIDRLAPSHQLALKAASVVGRIFPLQAVHEIYPVHEDKPRLENYFEHLRQLDLTPLYNETPSLSYLFKHIITQEVAYGLMPYSQRQVFHHAAATWYEKAFAEDLSPYYGVLAYHWTKANEPTRAMEYLEHAGEQAMTNFANREAIDFFEQAIRLAEKGEVKVSALRRAHWERQLAEAYYGLSELPKSRDHLKRAVRTMGFKTPDANFGFVTALLGETIKQIKFRMNPKPIANTHPPSYLDDTPQAKQLEGAIALARLGHIYFQSNQPIPMIYGNLHGLNLAEDAGVKSWVMVRCYANMCVATGVIPRHDWATAYGIRALAMARELNDTSVLAYALAAIGVYQIGTAQWESLTKGVSEAIELDAHIGNMRHFDESKSILAIARFHQGELAYSMGAAGEIIESATRRKDIIPQVWSHTMRAEIILRQSKPDTLNEAIAEYESTLKLLEQNIDLASDIRASGALALAYWQNGEPLRALDLATATANKTKGSPTAPYSIEGYAGVAEVFLSAWQDGDQQYRTAAQKACKAMDKFSSVFPLGRSRSKLYWGWFYGLDGKREQALDDWQKALAEAEKLELPYEQARALSFLGAHVQSPTEQAQYLARAREIFKRLEINL